MFKYSIFFLLILTGISCKDKVVCPNFQSAFILDDSVRTVYFSYLWYIEEKERQEFIQKNQDDSYFQNTDSMMLLASAGGSIAPFVDENFYEHTKHHKASIQKTKKTKFGIIKEAPFFPKAFKSLEMRTSPMENVTHPPIKKEKEETTPEPPLLSPNDTTQRGQDSLAQVTTKPQETKEEKEWERFKYGFQPHAHMQPDQDFYYKKYGWLLQNEKIPEDTVQNEEKKCFLSAWFGKKEGDEKGFFKRLFSKKNASDSVANKGDIPDSNFIEEEEEKEEDEGTN